MFSCGIVSTFAYLAEVQLGSVPLQFFPFQPTRLSLTRVLFPLLHKEHLLLFHLPFPILPYSLTCSQSLQSLLCLTQLLLSLLSLLHHPSIGFLQLQATRRHKVFIKVLVLHAVDARVCGGHDLDAMFKLKEEHLCEDDVVVCVGDLDTVGKGEGRRRRT